MKVYSILILFCFLETLLCNAEGVDANTFKNAFNKALPYMKTFHQSIFDIPDKNNFSGVKLHFEELNSNNVLFTFDEFGLLHIKFVNLKLKITGNFHYKIMFFFANTEFSAQLTNFNWEETYALSSTKLANGKYSIKYKFTADTDINFSTLTPQLNNDKLKKFSEAVIKGNLKTLDFSSFKLHLKKLVKLIFDTIQNN